ncbi:hypothetical protein HJC23_003448 [Cyclotella cryptica]|uniref:Glutamate--cysteine ligase n=1 Tax=Cyclotella cryptica TaxID=29204 RepID=A0ABD3QSK7_9STRA|eukprot:CCRYP_002599-RB/>CCRYP_002599-RB protein AED:0.09 eAED:0.09 QI:153/1/1/1/1/1/8/790/964
MRHRETASAPSSFLLFTERRIFTAVPVVLLFLFRSPLVSAFTLQMGLLKVGTPQPWPVSKKNLNYVREAGVRQFISTYNRVKDLKGDELMWGDEIEYGIFILEETNGVKKVRLSLRAKEIMDTLNQNEQLLSRETEGCNWVPEYGAWMVEATPSRPYNAYLTDLLRVERNMRLRRKRILAQLKENEIAPTVSVFPLLGVLGGDGSVPPVPVGGPITESEYIGDGIINPHPRFGALSANIRERRGEKVNIRVPLFHDKNTPEYENHPGYTDGTCCGDDNMLLWRFGKGDVSREKYGNGYVIVGCSNTAAGDFHDEGGPVTLEKWLVNVNCKGCKGLFYRSSPPQNNAPAVIVPDADWPRNGEIVVGAEIPDVPGWIRLQNGYYLPMYSDDGEINFLHKVSTKTHAKNQQQEQLGSVTPNFHQSLPASDMQELVLKYSLEAAVNTSFCNETSMVNLRPAIHMDAMAFGMGCCCLQITFQATDVDESRFLYDQLAVMAPIMMALTASTPVLKGRLADTDCRWGVICEGVDDRTPAERGREDSSDPDPEMAGKGRRRLYKSRYDSISTYLYQGSTAEDSHMKNRIINMYNDIPVPIDEDKYRDLRAAGIDPLLSQHIAHIFVRDPLVIFDGAVEEVDDETQTEHFESIQSTNWQTVRWKPPPPRNGPNDPHIGWRTEFRSMEIQLTDFENAAFTTFITLLTRVILTFDLNLYIPLSRVDANMQRAHGRNAAVKGKFFFRRHLAPLEEGDDGFGEQYTSMFSRAVNGLRSELPTIHSENNFQRLDTNTSLGSLQEVTEDGVSVKRRVAPNASGGPEENSYEEMTMAEIMTGKKDYFPGLIPLIYAYLDHIQCDSVTMERMTKYLDFIEKRATGQLLTPATWIRNFIRSHKDYKFDSVVTDAIAYDLLVACKEIGEGKRAAPELLGENIVKPILAANAYQKKLDSKRVNNSQILSLLERYSARKTFAETH